MTDQQEFLIIVRNTERLFNSMLAGDTAYELYRGCPEEFDSVDPDQLNFIELNNDFDSLRQENI